jgi:hypothetical protein
VCIHISENVLDEEGKISPTLMDQVARMGGHYYTRANQGLFQLPQPTTNIGIGVDQIPNDIRFSKILTGNDLGKLGGATELPDETSVNEYKLTELADIFIELEDDQQALEQKLHMRAHELLEHDKVEEAWMSLLAFNN